jgi:thiosulfate reductase/polysulfide reductase chain A
LTIHPNTAAAHGLQDGEWVEVEVAGGTGKCRLRLKFSEAQPADVVSTGMGWWRPGEPAPDHGALDVNINVALTYSGPYDPVSGSSDIRGQLCRIEKCRGRAA